MEKKNRKIKIKMDSSSLSFFFLYFCCFSLLFLTFVVSKERCCCRVVWLLELCWPLDSLFFCSLPLLPLFRLGSCGKLSSASVPSASPPLPNMSRRNQVPTLYVAGSRTTVFVKRATRESRPFVQEPGSRTTRRRFPRHSLCETCHAGIPTCRAGTWFPHYMSPVPAPQSL